MQCVRPERGGLHVVLDPHRHAERRPDGRSQVELIDAEIHRMHDAGSAGFDLSGDADADRLDHTAPLHLGTQRAHGFEDRADDSIRSPAGLKAHAPDDGAGGVDGDGVGLGSADVETDPHRLTSRRKAAAPGACISP
jgi:hypothetical protein